MYSGFPDKKPGYPNDRNPDFQQTPFEPYRFTREEMRVLRECNKESFYNRCVPYMTALGLGAYYTVHLGFLKPNAKLGAMPKVMFGVVIGYIAGKLSYRQKCEEKILQLPGGKLKESVLMRRRGTDGLLGSVEDGGVYSDASLGYAIPSFGMSSNEAKSIAELDTDRPVESYDDYFKKNSDLSGDIENLPSPPPSTTVTYEDLRSSNRKEFEERNRQYRSGPLDDYSPYASSTSVPKPDQNAAYAQPTPSPYGQQPSPYGQQSSPSAYGQPSVPGQPPPTFYGQPQAPTRTPSQRKNLYGDVIDK